jgi:hypothetical protein
VWIRDGEEERELKLGDELCERLFLEGRFPLPESLREIAPEEDISGHPLGEDLPYFAKVEKVGRAAELSRFHPSQIKEIRKEADGGLQIIRVRILAVPTACDGIRQGDTILTLRGGSGYVLAAALAKEARAVGATVLWTTPAAVKEERERRRQRRKKGEVEHRLLVELYQQRPELFHRLTAPDLKHLELVRAFQRLRLIQRDRIAAGQRLLKVLQDRLLFGKFPEGRVMKSLLEEKLESPSYRELLAQEQEAQEEVKRLYKEHPAYEPLMSRIDYMRDSYRIGPALLVAVGDPLNLAVEPDLEGVEDAAERRRRIRAARDKTAANFKALLGAHVRQGGRFGEVPPHEQFPRRRRGERANWNPEGRQALFLWTERVFMRRQIDAGKRWCQRLEEIYQRLRARYPHPVKVTRTVGGRKVEVELYRPGHLQKMARWRLATRFVEWWAPRLVKVMREAAAEAED